MKFLLNEVGVAGAPALSAAAGATATLKGGALGKLDTQLAALYLDQEGSAGAVASHLSRETGQDGFGTLISSVQHFTGAVTVGQNGETYVVVDATAKDGNGASLLSQLETIGLKGGASFAGMASGYLPVSSLKAMVSLANLAGASESASSTLAGLVTTQADPAQHADIARAAFDVDGTGLKIGVLSDSFNTSAAAASGTDNVLTNIASGDLPLATKVLQDSPNGTDEGRGMAQLIHDIAPGAAIDFATANGGQANFANNILALAADGAKVIVDDVIYFLEPAYQDGVIAQAIDQVAGQGVSYFSSAGNNGFEGYEQRWVSASNDADYQYMEFAPGQDLLPFVASGYADIFVMQWDEPSRSAGGAGSASDLDILVYDSKGTIVSGGGSDNIASGNPQEAFQFQGVEGQTYYLAVGLYAGPAPNYVKIMALGNGSGVDLGTTDRNINAGTTYGHAAAEGANSVGAAFYFDTPVYGTNPPLSENYSSGGPVRIAFDTEGQRLPTVELRNTTAFVAADGGNTTFFGSDIPSQYGDPDTYPNFFGTSAAAPGAAAVALLLLDANPQLTNADIRVLLQDSAIDMDNPYTNGFDVGYDEGTGTGFIQADRAVRYAATGVIDNDSAVMLRGTHLNDTIFAGVGNNLLDGGAGNDVLTGGVGADVFRFDSAATSGSDRITDFGAIDVILTTKQIRDGNGDGLITLGKNGVLDLETGANADRVTLDGVKAASGLRFLGSDDSGFYYGRADVRPTAGKGQTVVEGTLNDDKLALSRSGNHVVFVDTANALSIGSDVVTGFGKGDILVTTTRISDSNGDNLIQFGSDKILQLDGGDSLQLQMANNKSVQTLEYDGGVLHNGVSYYVYSMVGSSAGVSDLHFG